MDVNRLIIDGQTYNIKDLIAREGVEILDKDLNNTKINGIPLRGQNREFLDLIVQDPIHAISNAEIDTLIFT